MLQPAGLFFPPQVELLRNLVFFLALGLFVPFLPNSLSRHRAVLQWLSRSFLDPPSILANIVPPMT